MVSSRRPDGAALLRLDVRGDGVTLGHGPGGQDDFGEDFGQLRALVSDHVPDATGTDNNSLAICIIRFSF